MRFTAATTAATPGRVSLACYGEGGRAQRDVLVDVIEATTNPPPPPPPGCPTGPLISPAQWVNSGITWSGLGGNATYPPNQSTRTVVLGQYAYISLPFVPTAGSNMMMTLAGNQYTLDPSWGGMFVGVSECAADFRFGMATPPAAEPTLSNACRRTVQGPEIGFRVFSTSGGAGECVLTPGKTYYLNMIQAGSELGIINRQSDCSGERCGFQIKF